MVRVNIIVEGQSEETFVRDVLAPYLGASGVFAKARSIETSRSRGRIFRGGVISYLKAKRDIQRWISEDQGAVVSTMLDLYALPGDFPGMATLGGKVGLAKASHLESALLADIGGLNFVPYIQLHEFEALLFTSPETIDQSIPGASRLSELRAIRADYDSPEGINDHPQTAPSKRLKALFPSYDKVLYSRTILEKTGIDEVRKACGHFDAWIASLLQLSL
jgi:hypothetical protein